MTRGKYNKLGDVVAEFESGNAGVASISNGRGDPGGKSYGKYQLASKVGTLQSWLKQSKYKDYFKGVSLASRKFDNIWLHLARTEPEEFENDQHKYIKRTHFDPVRAIANLYAIKDTPALNEFLWSSSVQHSRKGNRKILSRAINSSSERGQLRSLFESRKSYVSGVRLPKLIKLAVLNRYEREEEKIVKYLINKE